EPAVDLGPRARSSQHVAAVVGAHDVDVAEEDAVQRDLRDGAADEADDEPAAAGAEAAHGVEHPVAANRVEDQVDAAAAGEGEGLVLPGPAAPDDVVSARLPRGALLVVAGHDADHGATQRARDLDRCGAGAAAGSVHQ